MTALPEPIADYLARLERALGRLPALERQDVVREITAHFEDALAAGENPEAAVSRMGNPDQVAAALADERLAALDRSRSPAQIVKLTVRAAALPLLLVTALFLALNVADLLYVYAGLLSKGVPWSTTGALLALNLPGVLAICLPIAVLFAGMAGLPSLDLELGRSLYQRIRRPFIVAVLVLGFGVSLFGVWFMDHAVAPANRGVVELVTRDLLPGQDVQHNGLVPQEQTRSELAQTIRDLQKPNPSDFRLTRDRQESKARRLFGLETAYHFKIAFPFNALATAALGLVLGEAYTRRRQRRMPLLLLTASGVITIMLTYTVMRAGMELGQAGHPVLGAWLPDLLVAVFSLAILGLDRLQRDGVDADA